MIANSGHDERGKYSGGRAGDQTGREWAVIPWYSRPWDTVLRHPDEKVRLMIVYLAKSAARNDLIGYNQAKRTTFWRELSRSGYDPLRITTPCDADCSAGVAAIVKAAGYRLGNQALQGVSPDMYTGNETETLRRAGFIVLKDQKYLASDRSLLPGDILLCTGHHTAINLDRGVMAQDPAPTDNPTPPAAKPDYEKLGWIHDDTGWWYAYGHRKGEYYINNAVRIDGKLYFFDASGYCVKNPVVKTEDSGALISISGERVR